METICWGAFVFAAGLTVCGLAATMLEIACGRPASFSPPFSVPDRVVRSLFAAFAAGPMMLFADALAARRGGTLGIAAFAVALGTALAWSFALGIVTIEIANLLWRPRTLA